MQVFDITLEGCKPGQNLGFLFKLTFLSLGLWTKGLAAAATSPIYLHKGATNWYFFSFSFWFTFPKSCLCDGQTAQCVRNVKSW